MEQEYFNSNPYYYPMDIPEEQILEFQKWHQYQLMMYQMNLYYNSFQPHYSYLTTGMFPANNYIQEEVGEQIVEQVKAVKEEEPELEPDSDPTPDLKKEDFPLIKPIYIDASDIENTKNIHEPGIIIDIGSKYFKPKYKIVRRLLDEQITHLIGCLGQLVPGAQLFYWYFPKELKVLDLLLIRDSTKKDEGYMEEYAFRIIGKIPINKKLPELSEYSDYCAICKWF